MNALPHNNPQILGVRFDLLTHETALAKIHMWREEGKQHYVMFGNPHTVLSCHSDTEMTHAARRAGLVLPDGVGITIAAHILGLQHSGRITGPSFMLRLCDWGRQHGYRHYFYGGKPGVAEQLVGRLTTRYPGLNVVGTFCPPFRRLSLAEDAQIVTEINHANPDVLWVGLGTPKQDKWMVSHIGRIHAPVMLGVGAAFDFHAGTIKWAPQWIRSHGLEWAYRLMTEPRRLWRRNLESPEFLMKVCYERLRLALSPHLPGHTPARAANR